jgi:uncharacterized protein (TIGR03086 family)
VGDARQDLLDRIVADVAASGLADRSLRDIAAAIGSSHRMLLYHFGSREGLVAAVVASVEAAQRALLAELAAQARDGPELVMALWERVSSPELRPFVRLFFESVAATAAPNGPAGGTDALTSPWLDDSQAVAGMLGVAYDPVEIRLGVAVTRGLLVDVLVSGDAGPATAALRRFVDRWLPRGDGAPGERSPDGEAATDPVRQAEVVTDIARRYARLAARFADTIAAVPEGAWERPSPCEGWTARDVVRHVVDTQEMFLGFVGRTMGQVPSVDDDPGAAFDAARAAVQADLEDPQRAGAVYQGFGGESTFEQGVDRFLSFDLVVHGWDLARAVGLDERMDPEEVRRLSEEVHGFGDAMRGPQAFGPEVEAPAGADEQARLLAFLGRRP